MAKDPNEFARSILDTIIAKHDPESVKGKDAKKVASGLKGGSKGGHARAKNLTAKKRSDIAKKAAKARWKSSES
ncbi:MAG: histone H1 [Pyrinomonadaceae bacterium]